MKLVEMHTLAHIDIKNNKKDKFINMKTKLRIGIMLFLIILIAIIITVLIIYFIKVKKNKKNDENIFEKDTILNNDIQLENSETNSFNNNKTENQSSKLSLDVISTEDMWKENEPIPDEKRKLYKVTDKYSYFLVKQGMTSFYLSQYHAHNALPEELRQYDISNFYKDENLSKFCMDSIYKTSISGSKDVYYVHYRLQNSNTSAESKTALVKIDRKNLSFGIYPYEYLKTINYADLKEGDIISTDLISIKDIERTELNHYNVSNISKDDETTLYELIERFQFDVQFDNEYLYSRIDSVYKTTRFNNNYENFVSFINSKKDEYINDKLNAYQVYDLKSYTQYIAQCKNNNIFIFNITNLMNYAVQFDMYTTVTPIYYKIYSSNFPKVQGKYCIDRIRKAINDKNYEFVYAKLDNAQKANFNSFDDFVSFIKKSFYDQNTFEIEKIEKKTEAIYVYTVKVTNTESKRISNNTYNMTITLKENADFTIIIAK